MKNNKEIKELIENLETYEFGLDCTLDNYDDYQSEVQKIRDDTRRLINKIMEESELEYRGDRLEQIKK